MLTCSSRALSPPHVRCPQSDQRETRKTDADAAASLAARYSAAYFECSSKNGDNCDAIFEHIGKLLMERGIGSGGTRGLGLAREPLVGGDAAVQVEVARRLRSGGCCS